MSTPVTIMSMIPVITEFWKAGSRPFHLEFRYMMNQLPPTTTKPNMNTVSPRMPPRNVHLWALFQRCDERARRRPRMPATRSTIPVSSSNVMMPM